MRIIGELPHDKYKITVFEMNKRISIQIEDGLLVQTYKFRDGSGIKSLADAAKFADESFFEALPKVFESMYGTRLGALQNFHNDNEESFDII